MPTPAPIVANSNADAPQVVAPLVYKAADHAPQPSTAESASAPPSSPAATQPKAQKQPGFFSKLGRFFKRIFGAE
jgi:hypothetical protein